MKVKFAVELDHAKVQESGQEEWGRRLGIQHTEGLPTWEEVYTTIAVEYLSEAKHWEYVRGSATTMEYKHNPVIGR